MDLDAINFEIIERLRQGFISGSAGERDYWRSREELAAYDQTFAQRIAWKWEFVLEELARRGWSLPGGAVLDWGCGSGVAGRVTAATFAGQVQSLVYWDRSPLAVAYAAERARAVQPQVEVQTSAQPPATFEGALLLSHVLTELSDEELEGLLGLAESAQAVIWAEPGTHEASRRLIEIRQRLMKNFNVVAPCTHQKSCPMLEAGNERHWCHHFADSPSDIFADSDWVRFGKLAGIDLRSLPMSYLVLDKRPAPALAAGAVRVIGRPRVFKAYAMLFGCDESGLAERRLSKRNLPEEFKALKREQCESLQFWRREGDEILAVERQ